MSPNNGRLWQFAVAGMLAALTGLGCASGPNVGNDPFVSRGQSCETGNCETGDCNGAYCAECEPPKRWSAAWYAMRADDPIGQRQRCKHGKVWPPFPRPTGRTQQLSHRYHANLYWPYPYICEDRAYVHNIHDVQVGNGWMEETTLYAHHFEEDTHKLNYAGRNHLQWILLETPAQRRAAFVQKSLDATVSEARLANVQAAATEMLAGEPCPPIVLRQATPEGTEAEYVDSIHRAIRDSIPEPRITYTALPSGTSGGN